MLKVVELGVGKTLRDQAFSRYYALDVKSVLFPLTPTGDGKERLAQELSRYE